MARMPSADWVGEQSPRTPMSRYDIFCVHTIVGYAPAHAAHFSTKADGHIFQSRDTRYQSAANLNGNYRVIASENEDHGDAYGTWTGSNVPPLTDAQVISNGRVLAWLNETHGIPLQLCPNSRAGSRGLAYHRQGIDGNFADYRFPGRVSGGEVWTLTPGKVCPGDKRIAQLPDILDVASTIRRGGSVPQEDDMQLTDIINPGADKKDQMSVGEALRIAARSSARGEQLLKGMADMADDIAAAVAEAVQADLGAGGGVEVGQLRRTVRGEVIAGVRKVLGSLDKPTTKA